jgi:hypothetical protein
MRILGIASSAALAVLLSACGGGDQAPPDAGNAADAANAATAGPEATQNQLEALPEGARNGVFIRAIRDSGNDCQNVESSTPAGEHQGLPLWRARCVDGVEWTIVIGNDGSAAVLNPAEAGLLEGNQATGGNAQ